MKEVRVYSGLVAKPVALKAENASAVLNYGHRFFVIGRLTANNEDMTNNGELVVERYIPDEDYSKLSASEQRGHHRTRASESGDYSLAGRRGRADDSGFDVV